MVVAKEKVVKKIEIANKKPLIRKNQETGEMVAGFLDPETGVISRLTCIQQAESFSTEKPR